MSRHRGQGARLVGLAAAALLLWPGYLLAQARADSAWLAGNTEMAGELYEARLVVDSTDEVALQRLALMKAWDAKYDESLALFDRLLAVSPDHLEARVDRAKVLAWSGDLSQAIEEVERVLEIDPSFVPALEARARYEAWRGDLTSAIAMQNELLGVAPESRDAWRAQATYLAWGDRNAEAVAIYDSLLNSDSTDVGAWSGYARVAAAEGRLVEAEKRWRRALAVVPKDASLHAGLGQTLRWQGRNSAAYRELRLATDLVPSNREAEAELRALRLDLSPRGEPGVQFTSDSDENDIVTVRGDASWHPSPSLEVTADAYFRDARFGGAGTLTRSAAGVEAGVSTLLEPGWRVAGSIGVSGSDGSAGTTGRFAARLKSPQRHRIVGSLDLSTGPLDESAVLIENGVTVDQLQVSGVARPGPEWRFDAAASVASFDGSESNRRLAGSLAAGRRLSSTWNVGLFARAFGFEKQLSDGYFDPDLYWIAEVTGTWSSGAGNWRFSLDAAPGIQQVGSGGETEAAIRAGGRVAYSMGPGRELSLRTLYSTTGLNSFATGASNYRYLSVGLNLTWAVY